MQIKNITKSISMNSSFAVRRLKFKNILGVFFSPVSTSPTSQSFCFEKNSVPVLYVEKCTHVYRNMVRRCQTQKPLDKKEKNK